MSYHALLCVKHTPTGFFTHIAFANVKCHYGVATISRLLKITCLFCRISSLLQGSFAKKTYHFKEPANLGHPMLSAVMNESYEGPLWRAIMKGHYEGPLWRAIMNKSYAVPWWITLTWHYRSLLQNIVSFIGLFGKRDLHVNCPYKFIIASAITRHTCLYEVPCSHFTHLILSLL